MEKDNLAQLTPAGKEPFYYDLTKKPEDGHLNIRLLSAWELDLENLDESLILKLLGVAQHNQLDWLKSGLEGNIPLNLIHEEGYTVLTVAAQFGAMDVAQYLVDLGLNPAFYAERGMFYNAYFSACAGGQFPMVTMLVAHPCKKISPDMVEPRHKQSGLQVAVHNLRFDFAKQFIDAYPDSLKQLDRLNRTVFATLLSIFVTSTFSYIEEEHAEKSLEDFCLYMLKKENPFQRISDKAIPAMQVVLQSKLASFHPADVTMQMSAFNGVRTIFLACPKFAEALMELASRNPKGILEHRFLLNANKHLAELDHLKSYKDKMAQIQQDQK